MEKEKLHNIKKDEDILFLVRCLSKKLRNSFDNRLAEKDLTAQQGRCLCFISKNNYLGIAVHQHDIEKEFELSKSTVSGLVDRLEKKGLITRTPSGSRTKIILTEKGEAVIDYIHEGRVETTNKLLNGFNDDEKSEILQIVKKLISNIKEVDENVE